MMGWGGRILGLSSLALALSWDSQISSRASLGGVVQGPDCGTVTKYKRQGEKLPNPCAVCFPMLSGVWCLRFLLLDKLGAGSTAIHVAAALDSWLSQRVAGALDWSGSI